MDKENLTLFLFLSTMKIKQLINIYNYLSSQSENLPGSKSKNSKHSLYDKLLKKFPDIEILHSFLNSDWIFAIETLKISAQIANNQKNSSIIYYSFRRQLSQEL